MLNKFSIILVSMATIGGASLLGPLAGQGFLLLALTFNGLAFIAPKLEKKVTQLCWAILWSLVAVLTWHSLIDDFSIYLVWLYSAPQLTFWQKISNLWSSEEGTLLLLAALSSSFVSLIRDYGKFANTAMRLIVACFISGALIWSAFALTPEADLAKIPYRGMNAHLTSFWMLIHPPLIFVSYILILLPFGAIIEALAHGRGAWGEIAKRFCGISWLVLTLGLAFGMWWAYEDFTYGTVWHWDPVQTAMFASWCFLTAILHMQKYYEPNGTFAILHPLAGSLATVSIMVVMVITRDDTLASSHQYVGQTSLTLWLLMTGGFLCALLISIIYRTKSLSLIPTFKNFRFFLLWASVIFFFLCAFIAWGHILQAWVFEYLSIEKPDHLKPFYETLKNFTPSSNFDPLKRVFDQWEVNNFSMNRWLISPLILGLFASALYFLPFSKKGRWMMGIAFIGSAIIAVKWGRFFETFYEGHGLTSSKTVVLFPLLNILLLAFLFLCFSLLLWGSKQGLSLSSGQLKLNGHALSIIFIHVGFLMALLGFLSATIFDTYDQQFVDIKKEGPTTVQFASGYKISINQLEESYIKDGQRRRSNNLTFQSVGTIEWAFTKNGQTLKKGGGQTIYRDLRPPFTTEVGAMRLMCEMLDYRYARFKSQSRQMIHPLVVRGLDKDIQIWVPAISRYKGKSEGTLPMIVKEYPLISLLWFGLFMSILAFICYRFIFQGRANGNRQ